jgi:hypothetical protein
MMRFTPDFGFWADDEASEWTRKSKAHILGYLVSVFVEGMRRPGWCWMVPFLLGGNAGAKESSSQGYIQLDLLDREAEEGEMVEYSVQLTTSDDDG